MLKLDSPLADVGMNQAKETATELGKRNFKYAFVSPYTRTLQTANEILVHHPIPIFLENGVSEWCPYQTPDPPSIKLLSVNFPNIDLQYKSKLPPPPMESNKQLLIRARKTIKHISQTCTDGDVLIVTHAAPAIMMVASFL